MSQGQEDDSIGLAELSYEESSLAERKQKDLIA